VRLQRFSATRSNSKTLHLRSAIVGLQHCVSGVVAHLRRPADRKFQSGPAVDRPSGFDRAFRTPVVCHRPGSAIQERTFSRMQSAMARFRRSRPLYGVVTALRSNFPAISVSSTSMPRLRTVLSIPCARVGPAPLADFRSAGGSALPSCDAALWRATGKISGTIDQCESYAA
jgi:hypothetical protein